MYKKAGSFSIEMLMFSFTNVVVKAISSRESEDITSIEDKLGRSLTTEEKERIGVGNLRLFLEELLRKRYSCVLTVQHIFIIFLVK